MSSGVAVSPDQVSVGVLVSAVPRDVVDVAVAAHGAGETLGWDVAAACGGLPDDGVVPVPR